ncbi:MAG: HEAT repeat domain-containing protein [Planctomycetota bacterium]
MKIRCVIASILCLLIFLGIWHLCSSSPTSNRVPGGADVVVSAPSTALASQPKPTALQPLDTVTVTSYSPPKVHDPQLAILVNRNAANRVTSDISARLPKVKNKDDFPALLSVLSDSQDDDTVRNEVASLLRRSNCSELLDTLMKVLNNTVEGPRFRAFVMQHLGQIVPDEQTDPDTRQKLIIRFRQALDDKDMPVRRQALQNLCRLNDAKGKETAIAWLNAKSAMAQPNLLENAQAENLRCHNADAVRDSAIRCVFDLGLREHIPIIRQYVRDQNDVIRIAAIVTLSQWGDEESRPAFEEAAHSPVARLQRTGQAALKQLDQAKKKSP